jgi:hypothetical protein
MNNTIGKVDAVLLKRPYKLEDRNVKILKNFRILGRRRIKICSKVNGMIDHFR